MAVELNLVKTRYWLHCSAPVWGSLARLKWRVDAAAQHVSLFCASQSDRCFISLDHGSNATRYQIMSIVRTSIMHTRKLHPRLTL